MATLYQRQMLQPSPPKGLSPLGHEDSPELLPCLPGYMEAQQRQRWMAHPMLKGFKKRRIVNSYFVRSVM